MFYLAFDLTRMLNHGYPPRMYQSTRPARLLDSYIADYLKEKVAAVGRCKFGQMACKAPS